MKRWVFLLVSLGVFLMFFGSVSGVGDSHTCPVENQTILTLNSVSNSHVSIYNQGTVDLNGRNSICYDEIFGENYSAVENPWVCGTGGNKVLGISSLRNAHAENGSLDNYQIDVCYGDLDCTVKNKADPAVDGEKPVLYLSSNTNAHVSAVDSSGYDLVVYCKSNNLPPPEAGAINSVSWRDSFGNIIDKSNVNSTVFLTADTTYTSGTVRFEIFEEDIASNDSIRTGNDALLGTVNQDGSVSINWGINDEDMERGDNLLEGNVLEFFFEASRDGNIISSGILEVSVFPKPSSNILDIEITGIKDGGLYFTGIPVEVNYSVSDPTQAQGLENMWSIPEDSYTNNELSFHYNFTSPGQKRVHLSSKNGAGAVAERQIEVLVIDPSSSDILAFIDNPRYNEVISVPEESIDVLYNGTGSYVVDSNYNVNDCSGSVSCLAGTCPGEVENPPTGCQAPVENSDQGYDKLNFTWTRHGEDSVEVILSGFGEISGESFFGNNEYSEDLNDRAFELNLEYNEGASLQQSTVRNFTIGQCIDGGRKFVETNSDGQVLRLLETTNKNDANFDASACNGANGITCCPAGHSCGAEGCYIPADDDGDVTSTVTGCSIYNGDEGACEDADIRSGSSDSCSDGGLTPITSCVWDDGLCKDKITIINTNAGNIESTCITATQVLTECKNGFQRVLISAELSNPNSCIDESKCQSGEQVVACGRPSFELPFFGFKQALLSVLLIGVVYMLLARYEISKNRRGRK